jgi:hypothetical protein
MMLERSVAHYKAELAVGPEDSDTFADPYGVPRPLGRGTSIVFTPHANVKHGIGRVTVRRQDDGKLHIMCDDTALIRPQSSNTFTVEAADR